MKPGDPYGQGTGPVIPNLEYEQDLQEYNAANKAYQDALSNKGDESLYRTAMFASGGILFLLSFICFVVASFVKSERSY